MTRTDNKPLFRNRNAARSALIEERARALRASPTPSEQLLWAHIRGRRLGVVFRRQLPLLGRFIADFLAPAQRLVIEIDGGYHAERLRTVMPCWLATAIGCFGSMPPRSCATSKRACRACVRRSACDARRALS